MKPGAARTANPPGTAVCSATGARSLRLPRQRSAMGRRSGLSLLEVILAIAILGLALAAIGELIRLGARSAIQTRMLSEAQLIADATMAELAAGAIDLQPANGVPVSYDPRWIYSVDVQLADYPGLLSVMVMVQPAAGIEVPVEFAITRLLPDPAYDPLLEEYRW